MRHTPNAVMIFAAGFGTRMKELTQDRPKPMIPVAGKPLIDHALELIEAAAILFGHLHTLDAKGASIAVAPIPDTGLGLAINDRLRRAAAPR